MGVCRHIRELSNVSIVFWAARSQEREIVAGLRLGADDYVRKPFDLDELTERIRAVLRHSDWPGEDTEAVYDDERPRFVIASRDLTKDGLPIALTSTEGDLLACLTQHAGTVVPCEQVLREAWGSDAGRDRRAIVVYIRYLWQKIEDEPSCPRFLLTRETEDYMLVPADEYETDPHEGPCARDGEHKVHRR